QHFDPLTGELIVEDLEHVAIWPATHYNVKEGTIEAAVLEIGRELNERCAELESSGKLLEAHRLRQRTQYDMEMLREVGFCFVFATPGAYERDHSARIVEQIVRPTGIIDPDVEVRETRNQIDDLMKEIRVRVDRNERTLVTTLTKKMSEDLTDYLLEMGFK